MTVGKDDDKPTEICGPALPRMGGLRKAGLEFQAAFQDNLPIRGQAVISDDSGGETMCYSHPLGL